MTFEEWLDEHEGYSTRKERFLYEWSEHCSPLPWLEAAWEAGIQEGVLRMYRLYDICPECNSFNGQHKIDCGRGR